MFDLLSWYHFHGRNPISSQIVIHSPIYELSQIFEDPDHFTDGDTLVILFCCFYLRVSILLVWQKLQSNRCTRFSIYLTFEWITVIIICGNSESVLISHAYRCLTFIACPLTYIIQYFLNQLRVRSAINCSSI